MYLYASISPIIPHSLDRDDIHLHPHLTRYSPHFYIPKTSPCVDFFKLPT